MRNLFKLYRNLKPFILMILGAIVLTFLQVMANLELPTLMSNIVDKGIITGDDRLHLEGGSATCC